MAQGDVHSVHTNRPLGDDDPPRPGPDSKFAKRAVNYAVADSKDESCAKCRFFQSGTCQLVRGSISPDAWCDLWTPRAPQGAGEAAMKEDATSKNPDDRAGMDGDSDDDDQMSEPCPACDGTGKVKGKLCRMCDGKGAVTKKAEEVNPKKLKPTQLSEQYLAKFYDLSKVKLLGDPDVGARSWVPVFPEGTFFHPEYGELIFDSESIPQYMKNFDDRVRHIDIAVDVDHRNEEAVGWVKQLDWRRGDGLYALVEWNRLGLQKVNDKQYRYISAQFGDYKDEQTRQTVDNVISALTITNFPFLKRMDAIQLSEQDMLRSTYARMVKLHKRLHRGDVAVPAKLHKVVDLWLEGRTLKALPTPQQRLDEGRAILASARRFSAQMGPNGSSKSGGKLPHEKSDFVPGQNDDEGGSLDDGDDTAKRSKKADDGDDAAYKKSKKAKRAALLAQLSALDDDETLDDDELDDDDLDDDDMKKSKKAYDQEDAYGEAANMDVHKDKSAQKDRSNAATPQPPREAGKASMSERSVSLKDFQVVQRQLSETRLQLREQAVDRQCSELQVGEVGFGADVIKKFRAIALADKKTGNAVFELLSAAKDEMVSLGEAGSGGESDESAPDVLDIKRTADGSMVVGLSLTRRAREFAAANKLDYNDPEDRLLAMEAVTTGGAEGGEKRPARAKGWR